MTIVANTIIFNNVNQGLATFDSAVKGGTLYMFAGRNLPWTTTDLVPDNINTSVQLTQYQLYDELIFGKAVTINDYVPMIKNNTWVSGATDIVSYDDQVSYTTEKFFVVTHENGYYHIFKCLNNNGGAASIYQPKLSETSESDDYYITADGYHWKYMYSITETIYNKFATNDYVPVYKNNNVAKYAANGSIDHINVDSGGFNYVATTNGYFTSIIVGGNSQLYAIQSADILTISYPYTSSLYISGETVSQANNVTNITVGLSGLTTTSYSTSTATVVSSNNTTLVLTTLNGAFNTSTPIVGATSLASVTPTSVVSNYVSPNTDFYTDSSIYIDSGTGAGQIRNISRYIVTGTQNRVLTDTAFSPQPDSTSHYVIAPKVSIIGDGSGAKAVSFVDVANKSISKIKVISKGQNYSYANVVVSGNTGSSSQYLNMTITGTTGTFQVGEKITEPYTGATAQVVTVNSSVMSVTNINGILSGNTTSTASFVANSTIVGASSLASASVITVGTSTATCRAIISPIGGHGSNPNYELNANRVGVTVTFSNTENGTVSIDNSYRRIGLLRNPLFSNVQIAIANSTGTFQIGESITQTTTSNSAYQIFINKLKSYTYNINNYNMLALTTATTASVGDTIIQVVPTSANGIVVSNSIANTLTVRVDTGKFAANSTIYNYSTGNTSLVIASGGVGPANTTYITGGDAANSIFAYNTNTYNIDVQLNNIPIPNLGVLPLSMITLSGPFTGNVTSANIVSSSPVFSNTLIGYDLYFTSNTSKLGTVLSVANTTSLTISNIPSLAFTTNTLSISIKNTTQPAYSVSNTALTIYNKALANGDIVTANVYIQTAAVSSNAGYSATGIVTASNTTSVTMTSVNGYFTTGTTILGSNSFYVANVTSVAGQPYPTFNQTTRLACAYQSGSQLFLQNDYVQQGTIGLDGAYGYIQSIDPVTINTGAGTLNTGTGTAIVTGTGTNFTSTLIPGGVLYVASNNALVGKVLSVGNNTSVTLTSNSYLDLTGVNYLYANTSGNYIVALTGVKGIFQSSDLANTSPKYITSLDTTKNMKVSGVINPQLIPYTGEMMYVENITPVTRSTSQAETIKVVLNFY